MAVKAPHEDPRRGIMLKWPVRFRHGSRRCSPAAAGGMPVDVSEWAVEPKRDGWRCLARIDNGALRLTSRWRNDLTAMFPELGGDLPNELADRRVLLDGEIVALRRDGSQDFHALTNRRPRGTAQLAFLYFDVLHVDGHDLMARSYATRRHALEKLHPRQDRWLTTPSLPNEARAALYGFTLAQGWEGVVAKRLDAPYRPAARNGAWLKTKHPHARDLQSDRSTWTQRENAPIDEPLIAYR